MLLIPMVENKNMATLPFKTTSKMEIAGIMEAKKYMLVMITMESK